MADCRSAVELEEGRGVLTQAGQPALELLHGGLEARLLGADHQPAARVEDVEGVHRLQLDLHAQLLHHPQEVQHQAVRGHQLVVRLGAGREHHNTRVQLSTTTG